MNTVKKQTAQKTVKCPTKRTVNLAKRESHTRSVLTLVCGALIIVLLSAAVAKFGVIDQLARLDEAEQAYHEVHAQHLAMEEAIAAYPEVEQEYRTYSRKWMTDSSTLSVSVDRMEVLDLLQTQLMSCGTVKSFLVQDSTVFVTMSGMDLEEISAMFAELQRQPIVASAALTIASTAQDSSASDLDFSITIILQPAEEAES